MSKPYLRHLKSSKDLETTYEAIRAGFVALALEKNRRATPLVAQARDLKAAAAQARTPADLLGMREIHPALLTAAAVSDKAAKHLAEADKHQAILGLIENFLAKAGADFVEELVFRFLLTRGDTLGGSMRNLGGVLAQRKLTYSIIAHLRNTGRAFQWLDSATERWSAMPDDDAELEVRLGGLSWHTGRKPRTLVFNVRVPVAGTHVDMCLLDCAPAKLTSNLYKAAAAYLALGELKGGIDPNGADEHWKTTRSALSRLHEAFARNQLKPHTFFIGAVIVTKMATEIWSFLERGILENAANLTEDRQTASITRWLCSL